MNKHGVIYLIDRGGNHVTARPYHSPGHRKQILEVWRKMYAAKYYSCYIQISPYADATRVKADGTNSKKKKEVTV